MILAACKQNGIVSSLLPFN